MLSDYIGEKVRIVVYKNNEVEVDMICRKLDKEIAALFDKYKFIGYHKTQITSLNVIELNAADENKEVK